MSEYYPVEERAFASDVILKAMVEQGRWSGRDAFSTLADRGRDSRLRRALHDPRSQRPARVLAHGHRHATSRRLRKANAQKLRDSQERFRLTIDEAPIGMALVDLDGRFVRVNRALCEIVGYPREELERLKFRDITHPDDLDTDLELAGRLGRGEIPRCQFEKRYIRKDGSRRPPC